MRIIICDDHRLFVEALATAIVRAGHRVEAVTLAPAAALAAVRQHRPDILLLDLNFPDSDSLVAAREMVARHPQTRIVVLTGSEAVQPLQDALDIGVAGYLRKDERIDHMLEALERCTRGERVVDEVLARRLARAVRERSQGRAPSYELTGREIDVANLLKEGCNTAEMVARLGISDSTIRTHVQSILNKLCVHSRVEAVALLEAQPAEAVS